MKRIGAPQNSFISSQSKAMIGLPLEIQDFGVSLQALKIDGIEKLRQWRNHPEVSRHMINDAYISKRQQKEWFEHIRQAQDRAYYLIRWRGIDTGFASATSTSEAPLAQAFELEAAIYFAPNSPLRSNMLAFAPALVLNDACFEALPCQCLVAKVKEGNHAALRFNTAMGYQEVARKAGMVHLILEPKNYYQSTQALRKILQRTSTKTAHE
jgi:RimJ/RimL family protein N-acetyltransferase